MRSGFFNSNIVGWDDRTGLPKFDKAEDAEFLAKFFSILSQNGIYAETGYEYQVITNGATGMQAFVKGGIAMINGLMAWEENTRTIVFQASESLDRIDRVVLRLDLATRTIDLFVKKGVASSRPEAPALTRPITGQNGDIYELGIADVLITKNSTTITQSKITDTRFNSDLCGVIYPRMPKVDTMAIFTQLTAAVDEHMDIVKSALNETLAGDLLDKIGYTARKINEVEFAITSNKLDVTLKANEWRGSSAPYTYRITAGSVLPISNQDVTFSENATFEQIKALQKANIVGGSQGMGYFELKAYGAKPNIDVPVSVLVRLV